MGIKSNSTSLESTQDFGLFNFGHTMGDFVRTVELEDFRHICTLFIYKIPSERSTVLKQPIVVGLLQLLCG